MQVYAIQCPKCRDIIFSRAHYDCHHCTCGACMIDGGFEYSRVGFSLDVGEPLRVELEVNLTKQELYSDWNKRINKHGTLSEANYDKKLYKIIVPNRV